MHYPSLSAQTTSSLRLPTALLAAFRETCMVRDTSISQALRGFQRDYADSNGAVLSQCPITTADLGLGPNPRRDALFNYRATAALLEAFRTACETNNVSCAAVLEALVIQYVAANRQAVRNCVVAGVLNRDFELDLDTKRRRELRDRLERKYQSDMLAGMFRTQGASEEDIPGLVQEHLTATEAAHD